MPERIQLKRSKGLRMPPDTVKVDRSTKFGNPFVICGEVKDAHQAIALFEHWLVTTPEGRAMAASAKAELRGKNLACWCKPGSPCHSDVLLRVAKS